MVRTTIDRDFIISRYRPAAQDTHKGTQGHALLIGGSYGKIGAVCLSAKAALKSGCGLVTAFIPECGYVVMQTAIPEVMVVTDESMKFISDINYGIKPQAIGVGPGMGQEPATQKAFLRFLESVSTSIVVDADALNILSINKTALKLLPPRSILTPHLKELERLIGKWNSDEKMLEMTAAFSKEYSCIIVVKGAPTVIVDADSKFENTTGNAALATAGSGDVLTGIITGLLAQGYSSVDAAIIGVYLHGLTADLAAAHTGTESFTASDIIVYLGEAFLSLH
ncbi:MAG TPA: NAD(P)H-hydrate dehydratase [Flavobacterium sp.]|jgi:hydroxyethylthiazole kinase-like uncharacterized protein yjeF